MRAQLLSLSGPYRGRTITYGQRRIVLGTASDCDLRFPEGGPVAERHAELRFEEKECAFHLGARDGEVFVGNRQIEEVILEPGDLLEVGRDGPKLRFRVQEGEGAVCKPVRQMLRDARDVGNVSGILTMTRSLQRDLLSHATWRLRIGFPVFLLLVVCAMAYLGGWLGGKKRLDEQAERHQQQTRLYGRELARLRDQLDEFRRTQAGHASAAEVAQLRTELQQQTDVVDALAKRDAALTRVLEVYTRGVCLVHGIFTLQGQKSGTWADVTGPGGKPLRLEYIGTGFLASEQGHVITNRHVAEPWWRNRTVGPLVARGLRPTFVLLEAVFPERAPVRVDAATIRFSDDHIDLAVFRVEPDPAIPVLPLHRGQATAFRGDRVILLGYPTGINAVLARAEPEMVQEVLAAASDTTALVAELARRKAISPVITQGALNEVKERKLVYDAATTSGGSGGPVFGPDGTVLGVNFAITRDFGGSNFGVPIRFALRLLPAGR